MENINFKQLLVEAGRKMIDDALTVETWGNISVCDRANGRVYMTPSGMDYHTISEQDIVVTDINANVIEGCRKPSIELGLHTLIYRTRADAAAVLHTHPIYSTVFSCMGEGIPLFHDEAAQALGDHIKTAKYALPGSAELANYCVEALGQTANACLLQSHGAVCIGADIVSCFKVATVLEMVAQIYQLIRATGGTFCPISDENIDIMRKYAKTEYGQR